jgi:hypothetical protein
VYEPKLNERGLFDLIWLPLKASVHYFDLFTGLYSLGRSVYNTYNNCDGENTVDCLFSVVDTLFETYCSTYDFIDVFSKRDMDTIPLDYQIHGIHQSKTGRAVIAHIPVNGSLIAAANAVAINTTWTRIATVVHTDNSFRPILHRLASNEDLGRPNNGSYSHLRVGAINSTFSTNTTLAKREEQDEKDGLIGDYIYDNNNQGVWDYFSEVNPSDAGSQVANWMEENNSEVSCVVPGVQTTVSDPPINQGYYGDIGADHGVLAYGWNNKAYDWNGKSGGWLDDCAYSVE